MSDHEVARIRKVYADWKDRLAGSRAADSTNPGNRYALDELHHSLLQMLRTRLRKPVAECRVLDIGCGFGDLLGWLHEAGVPAENLYGIDLLQGAIDVARQRFPQFTVRLSNAEHLDFPDASFHLVLFSTVFSSIFDSGMEANLVREAGRVLSSDGAILWYDMRYPNPSNPQVRGITKSRIRRLFPGYTLDLTLITLVPPLARRLGRLTTLIYPMLSLLPFFRTHYLGLLWPPREYPGGVAG
jgi:ubiquinone/menaquinone biosynthesis C-methylase UbiE